MAPKNRTNVIPQDSQLTALRKGSQDEVVEVIEKDSSSSSQRKRPTKASPYATAAKFVDLAELFESPKASEIVATHTGILSIASAASDAPARMMPSACHTPPQEG
jgi:hypothetical protein